MAVRVQTIDVGSGTQAYYAAATVTQSSHSDLMHVSGQVGTTKDGQVPQDYESQIHLALFNLRKILIAADATVSDILKLTLYIVNYDPSQRKHTKLVQKFLAGHRPATTLVPVQQLAVPAWLFEVDAVVTRQRQPTDTQLVQLTKSLDLTPTARADVVVVGAGLAGLSAARSLNDSGLSCIVLEARDRVGGRTWSKELANSGGIVDLGAAWINDSNQSRMITIARSCGATLVEQNTTGNCVLQDRDGSLRHFPYGELPSFSDEIQAQIAKIRDTTEADCQKLDCAYPRDADLDSMTFLAYLKSRGASDVAISTATVWTRAMLGQEPEEISALYFLNYCKSGGGLLQMRSDRKHGGQYLRVKEGTQPFAKSLADSLPKAVVHLGSPVSSIQQISKHTTVVQSKGQTFACRKVVVAIPPPVLRTISFQPPLPTEKKVLVDSFKYGFYQKVMVVFKTPFWVEKGFCGLAQSFVGPAAVVRDTSVPADNKWVLTYFLAGALGEAWSRLSQTEREAALLQQAGDLYEDHARVKQDYVEMTGLDWREEAFSGYGCPSPSLAPGVLDTVGHALRDPFGNVHFVGTETAEEWKGYMEGAVRSGERGAREIIGDLRHVVAKL